MLYTLRQQALKLASFKFKPFSQKQLQILTWWKHPKTKDKDGIIAHGAIRSGKTLVFSLSYVVWAMTTFNYQNFGICGKSVGVVRRNIIFWLKLILRGRGYKVEDLKTENLLTISKGDKINFFYIFGGKDERSQDFIQGITLAGCLFDEVALMPENFVTQATGRCSVEGSKFWFNCNPDSPNHWFKRLWLDIAKKKNLLVLHFTMDDNLSLSEKVKQRYRNLYAGVFFKRFILGLWVQAEGAIFDMLDDDQNYYDILPDNPNGYDRYISVDYGTTNPCVFMDYWDDGQTIFQENLYYWDSKVEGRQKTDADYADDFEGFAGEDYDGIVIIDPSAASFKAELRNRGYRIKDADNEVNEGIRVTSTAIARRLIKFNRRNTKVRDELCGYVWDSKRTDKGKELPVKIADHCADAVRYFCKTMFNQIFKWRVNAEI